MAENVEEQEVARFYTRAHRFPKMVGRMHDGTRIPGGPYTLAQAGVGGIILLIALITRAKWGTGNILFDLPMIVGFAWGGAWLAGRIPSTRRNLLHVITGAIGAMRRPVAGKYRGAPVQLRKPHSVHGRTGIRLTTSTPAAAIPPRAASPARLPSTPALSQAGDELRVVVVDTTGQQQQPRTPALSGVERLLELARTK
jgi:hypothetical protein